MPDYQKNIKSLHDYKALSTDLLAELKKQHEIDCKRCREWYREVWGMDLEMSSCDSCEIVNVKLMRYAEEVLK